MMLARLVPHDTLFLPDGASFNKDDFGRSIAASAFPPLPHQVFSAIRLAIAHALGATIPPGGRWNPEDPMKLLWVGAKLGDIVGDGMSDLGCLRLDRLGVTTGDGKVWLPCPNIVPSATNGSRLRQFSGEAAGTVQWEGVRSDLNHLSQESRFIGNAESAHESISMGLFIRDSALARLCEDPTAVLSGIEFRNESELFATENYVGLELDSAKANIPGQLYNIAHRRGTTSLVGRESSVSCRLRLDLPQENSEALMSSLIGRVIGGQLGGRGRSVSVQFAYEGKSVGLVEPEGFPNSAFRVRIYATAPSILGPNVVRELRSGEAYLGVAGARLISAVHSRPRRYSAWNSDAGSRTDWIWILPTGAVFDVQITNDSALEEMKERLHSQGLNLLRDVDQNKRSRQMGFGDFEIGAAVSHTARNGATE